MSLAPLDGVLETRAISAPLTGERTVRSPWLKASFGTPSCRIRSAVSAGLGIVELSVAVI
jgi:hypothetical protein